ncbi:hypothetical protein EAF00_011367 [Botryotinia globosa]|nr:hypothetical protein EAF00_011367 [Botryotinia globosa]
MDDPLLQLAGLPGMRSLGKGHSLTTELIAHQHKIIFTTSGHRMTVEDGRVRYLERSNLAPFSTNRNTFLGLPCDHKDEWLLKGLMLLPLPIREIVYEHTVHYEGLLSWVTTNEVSTHPLKTRILEVTSIPEFSSVPEEYDGIPTLENKLKLWSEYAEGEFCWIRGIAEALRRKQNNGSQDAKYVLIDFLGFLSTRIVWCIKCCNQPWMNDLNVPIIEKSLTWIRRSKLFHPCIKHISIDFDPRDEFNVPFFEDFVALCSYISANIPDLESAILWLTITEDDFQEILKVPMRFSWVQVFRELPVEKVDICPLLIKSGESAAARKKRLRRSIGGRDIFLGPTPC